MSAKPIAITQQGVNRAAPPNIHDAIINEVDVTWAHQALIGTMLERDRDPVGRGALQVAQGHALKLEDIRTVIENIRASKA